MSAEAEGTADQATEEFRPDKIEYVSYGGEQHLPLVMKLVDEELSEPYSIFTYRYFVYIWPNLTFLVCALHIFFAFFLLFQIICIMVAQFSCLCDMKIHLLEDPVYTEMIMYCSMI
jgi:hypothetical protein